MDYTAAFLLSEMDTHQSREITTSVMGKQHYYLDYSTAVMGRWIGAC
jgi:hypothetical protein